MFSSTYQKMICVLIVLSCAVCARSQSVPAKEATSTVSGRVTIKDKPLAGVVINLRSNRYSAQERPINYKGKTDANGEYRIANVPAGTYVIMPLAPALVAEQEAPQGRTLIVNKGETIEHIDFSLLRGAAITGKVVDADGRPLIEERVFIFNAQTNERFYFANSDVFTDDRGIYRAYGLRPGSYKVGAGQGDEGSYGGYRPATFKRAYYPSVPDVAQATVLELSEGGEATNVDIVVGRSITTYSASGRIVDGETGQPLANVGYGVMHHITPNNHASLSTGAVSNSRGEFKLENLTPGKYAVQIKPQPNSNWRAEDVQFEIVDDDVTGLVVQTRKGASLSGVVMLEGTVDKSARDDLRRVMLTAMAEQHEDRPFSSWSIIGADGSFSMTGLAGGMAVLRLGNSSRFRIVRVERNGVVQGRGVEVKDGETISDLRVFVAYGNASIRGVIEVANGALPPSSRFYVWLRNVADDPTMGMSSNGPSDVDTRGQFVIEGLLPGTYEVNAGVVSEQLHTLLGSKKQQVVVNAGSVINITISVELNPNPVRP
jgi:protocatechuate 3,4-dioxygenase beta subunit